MDQEQVMLKQKILSSLVALSFGASGAVFAQGYPWPQSNDAPQRAQVDRGYHGDTRNGYHGDQRAPQHNDYRGNNYRGNDYRGNDHRDNGYHGDRHDRGAGPNHAWYRGDRLPSEYRSRQYVVNDWRGHHLSAPPAGYHWVQAGGDYVLAAIATGVIAAILLNQ
jgi:Ni/Co efflux regulator RcnB